MHEMSDGESDIWQVIMSIPSSMRSEVMKFLIAGDRPREWPFKDEKTVINIALSIVRRLALEKEITVEKLEKIVSVIEGAKQKILERLRNNEL